jgi:hypothetical protein
MEKRYFKPSISETRLAYRHKHNHNGRFGKGMIALKKLKHG